MGRPAEKSTPRKIQARSKSAKANANTPEKSSVKTKGQKEPPKKVFAAQANYQAFCKNYLSCTNEKCEKVHTSKEEVEKHIEKWKKTKDAPSKRSASNRRGRTGRPDTPRQ